MTNHRTISELDYNDDNDTDFRADVFNLNNLADSSDEERQKPAQSTRTSSLRSKPAKQPVRDSTSWSEKFRELQDENTRLRKISAEKDYEIKYLKKKIDEEKKFFDGPVSNEVAATKIIELGKKVRELTAQLESERTKNSKLNKNVKDLENKLDNVDSVGKSMDESKEAALRTENKELKEKMNQLTHNLMEVKSQAEILKQDLKKAHKALEKEVGESVDIKSILSGHTNWKGRQQQIILLQNKMENLKKKVSMNEMSAIGSRMEEDELNDTAFLYETRNKTFSLYSGSATSARTNFDRMHMDDLKRIEKDKREKFEKLKKDNEALETDFGKMKEKFDSMKVRNSVLSNENKSLKDQVKTLIEKGKHDNELIEMLMKKQSQFKDIIENITAQNEKANKEIQEKNTQ
ncbi:Coiled-coil domain-containing 13, partial [Brachionus plicatilis]